MNTQLYIEGYSVDLAEDILFPVNYSIADVKDISTTKSPYTKTISVPSTQNNDRLFNYLFDIKVTQVDLNKAENIAGNLDFKKKLSCYILSDQQVQLRGYAKLLSAVTVKGVTTYSIQVTSELGNFISTLASKTLQDIEPEYTEQYTHTADLETIINSWTVNDSAENPGSTFMYPLIDYGQHETTNATNFYISNLRPGLFAKNYLDLIFQSNGFTYDSTFLNSEYFKRMFILYKDGDYEGGGFETIATMSAGTTLVGTQDGYYSPAVTEYYFDETVKDNPLNPLYNDSDRSYTAPVSTYYDIKVNFPSFTFKFECLNGSAKLSNTRQRLWVVYEVYNSDYSTGYIAASWFKDWAPYEIIENVSFQSGSPNTFETSPITLDVPLQRLLVNEGEHIKVSFYLANFKPRSEQIISLIAGAITGKTDIKIQDTNNLPLLTVKTSTLFDNALVTYNDFVLKDTRQIDFFASICKLFDLFPVPDVDRPRHFNILTADEYYNNDKKPLDWRDKLDLSEGVEITPIPNLDSRTLKFSYKEDKDFWNEQYKSLTGGNYGELTVDTGYEYSNAEKNVLEKNIFSATPVVQYSNEPIPCEVTCEILVSNKKRFQVTGYNEMKGTELPSGNPFAHARLGVKILYWGTEYIIEKVINPFCFEVNADVTRTDGAIDGTYYCKADVFTYKTYNEKIIPAIYSSSDQNISRKPLKVNPRILYYQGINKCDAYFIQLTPLLIDKAYTYYNNTAYAQLKTAYPVLSNLNSYVIPTKDILFARPKTVFYNINNYPNENSDQFSNLYKYWENTVKEITDNEAKLVTCRLRLNSIDIANLDLTRKVFISGTLYRINAIKDFIPNSNLTTEVELIRCPTLVHYRIPVCVSYKARLNDGVSGSRLLQYIDCEGTLKQVSMSHPSAYDFDFCTQEGKVFPDENITLYALGVCGEPLVCRSYTVENKTSFTITTGFIDCGGNFDFVVLGDSETITVCAIKDTINNGFNYLEITDIGECLPPPPCISYEVTNKTSFTIDTGYTDCNGEEQELSFEAHETKTVCAQPDSIINGFDYLTIIDKGECLPPCIQYSLTNTSTELGIFVYYTNCSNEETSTHLDPEQMKLICALEGSVSASPDVTVTETGLTCGEDPEEPDEEATVEVENNSSWGGKNITGVEVNGVGVDGITFPITTGNSGTGTTDQVGTYTIHVAVIGKTDRSVTVIDSSDTETCLDCVSNSAETLSFSGQTLVNGTTVTVKYNNSNCASDCKQYSIYNTTGFGTDVYYTNCSGTETSTHLNANQTKFVCAKENSVTASPDITITATGFPC